MLERSPLKTPVIRVLLQTLQNALARPSCLRARNHGPTGGRCKLLDLEGEVDLLASGVSREQRPCTAREVQLVQPRYQAIDCRSILWSVESPLREL